MLGRGRPTPTHAPPLPATQPRNPDKSASPCLPVLDAPEATSYSKSQQRADKCVLAAMQVVQLEIEIQSEGKEMSQHTRGAEKGSASNGLHERLQQIIELLYKNNAQFARGLPSEEQFKGILEHCYNCYDQLDFIVLDYARHPVNYLDPKLIADCMHRAMRATKYLFGNVRHWVETYSLDILRRVWEGKNYFPLEANHQPKCSSCNHYLEQFVIKEAKEEILGHYDVRQIYEDELREERTESIQRPLPDKESVEYVGSVNYLTRIIKEMEDSAHGYSKLTETIEHDDENEEGSMKYLADLLTSMKRRLGEKVIYRLKKLIKNWEKNEGLDQSRQRATFEVRHEFYEGYVPAETKKTITAAMVKRLREDNHNLQTQNKNLLAACTAAKNSVTYLQKREEVQRREMERLNQLIDETNAEKRVLISEINSSKRSSLTAQPGLALGPSSKTIAAKASQNMLSISKKPSSRYSKFKVQRMSRQSEAYSSGTDQTLDFADSNPNEINISEQDELDQENSIDEAATADVGCQWEEPFPDDRAGKLKEKSSRNSKMLKSSNRERVAIQKISKIIEEEDDKNRTLPAYTSSDKKRSSKALDYKSSKPPTEKGNRLSLEENHTIKKFMESQKSSALDLCLGEDSKKHKTSVKLLESESSAQKISLEKANIYSSTSKLRELNLGKGNSKDPQKENEENSFGKEIKKLLNCRFATEGAEVKRKAKRVRNNLFKPEHLSLFGGVSESYAYEKSSEEQEKLDEQGEKYLLALKNHLMNLSSFKNALYDNIVMFLKQPFTLIDRNEMELRPVGEKELRRLLLKLLGLHRRKCSRVDCEHLAAFNILIGFH